MSWLTTQRRSKSEEVINEHVEAEQDQIAAIDGKSAGLERALAHAYAEGLMAGLDSGALSEP